MSLIYRHELEQRFDNYYTKWEEKTNIRKLIPVGSHMMVWEDKASFMSEMVLLHDMRTRGVKDYYLGESHIPYSSIYPNSNPPQPNLSISHDTLHIPIMAKKDTVVMFRLVTDEEQLTDGYGLWVKMYKEKTYIPALDKEIVAYGVYEKYIAKEKYDFPNSVYTTKSNPIIYTPSTPPTNGLGSKYSGKVTYPNTPVPFKPHIKWVCHICGGDTSGVEYDYLGSGTNHLQCELNQHIPNKFALEN